MSWKNQSQRHSMASRGIKTNWREPLYHDDIGDPEYFEKMTEFISFKKAQTLLQKYPDALIVDAKNKSGACVLDGADGVHFKSSNFATYITLDGMRIQRGSVRDHSNKFVDLTGEEEMRLSLTSGRKAYSSSKLKSVQFQLGIPKKEYMEEMNKIYTR